MDRSTTSTKATDEALGLNVAPTAFEIARLRKAILAKFSNTPRLDAHLTLMDARGVAVAIRMIDSYRVDDPLSFLGLGRHVVRTQTLHAPPQPDVEGWLAAGVPTDPDLAEAWEFVHLSRYPTIRLDDLASRVDVEVDQSVAHMDVIVTDWLDDLPVFMRTYSEVETAMELVGAVMPPIAL